MSEPLRIFIGWDSREPIAYEVAKASALKHSSIPLEIVPIKLQDLVDEGVYTREVDPLASTEFTYSRFSRHGLRAIRDGRFSAIATSFSLAILLACNPIMIRRRPFIAFSTITNPKTV